MTKKLRKAIIFALLAVFIAAGSLFYAVSVNAESWKYSGEILSSYNFGDTLTVPDATLSVGGKDVEASFSVTMPDGSATTERKVKLDSAGEYSVKYAAISDGKVYTKTHNFKVDYVAYYIDGDTGTASYGKYTKFGANSEGLLVRLAKGETLTFTRLVDVGSLNDANKLIEGFITPDERGSADFDKLTLMITDAKDPSVYVRMDINRWTTNNNGKQLSWVSAGGNGQDMVGVENANKIHINDNVGVCISLTWTAQQTVNNNGYQTWEGKTVDCVPDSKLFNLTFDNERKIARSQGNLICDLTNTSYFKDVWEGFTSDKVRLSVYASGYQGQTANFCLTSVFGADLTGNSFEDEDAPVLNVKLGEDEMPEAALGTAYKIPEAEAYDDYAGNVNVKVSVIYNYSSNTPVTIGVSDGKFVPDRKGFYTIVYECEDYAGNSARAERTVHAGGKIEELKVNLPETREENVTLGSFANVGEALATGGSGNKEIVVTVTHAGKTQAIDNSFMPDEVGDWTVTYTATDYLGTEASVSYVVKATAGDKPIYQGVPAIAPIYIAGSGYVLPEFYGYVTENGKLVRKLCSVKIEDANGTKVYSAGEKFVPAVSKTGDSVKVTYYCQSEEYAASEESIPVVIAREGDEVYQNRFFYGEGVKVSGRTSDGILLDSGLMVSLSAPADKVGWTFANAQLVENFSFSFSTYEKSSKFGSLELICTDASDPSVSVSLKIGISASGTTLTSGKNVATISDTLKADADFDISYGNGKFTFNNSNVKVTETTDGKEFKGFKSDKIYFSFYAYDVKIGAAYRVESVGDNNITADNADFGSPVINITGDYGGYRKIDSEYVVGRAICGDVFAPNVSASVSVYGPNQEILFDESGLKLENVSADREYRIKLAEYGVYNVRYTAREENWVDNYKNFTAYITVADEIAPVIEATSSYTKEVKVGENIILPDVKVTDNLTAEDKMTIMRYVVNSEGRYVILKGGSNSLVATVSGVYTVCITAMDEAGNTATVSFEVVVND